MPGPDMDFDVSGWRELRSGQFFDYGHVYVLHDGVIAGRMNGPTSGREFTAPSGKQYHWRQICLQDTDKFYMTVAVELPEDEDTGRPVVEAPLPFASGLQMPSVYATYDAPMPSEGYFYVGVGPKA